MSIFQRDAPRVGAGGGRRPRGSEPADGGHGRSLIAAGVRVVGEISGRGGLRLEGQIEGEIRLDGEVVIGSGGRVRGRIAAQVVRIAGEARGDVRGTELVEIVPSGSLAGDVTAPRMVIADGAFFKGSVEMPAAQRPRSPAEERS